MDHVTGLSGRKVVGVGELNIAKQYSDCEEDEKPVESSDFMRTMSYPGDRSTDSTCSKKTEASAGRERIRIVFKRKAFGEDHAVNVVGQPPLKKQSVIVSSDVLTHASPEKNPGGTGIEPQECRIQGVVRADLPQDSCDILGDHGLLLKTFPLESDCHPSGIGTADIDGRCCSAPSHPMSSVRTIATSSRGLVNASEVIGSCTACLTDVSSVTVGHDSCIEPASKELSMGTHCASCEMDATTPGSADLELSQCSMPDVRPKARRTPLAFLPSGVRALEGETQVTVCSPLTASPNSNSIPPPAKRSPLPLPVARSPFLPSTQNQVSSAESSVDVGLSSIGLHDESVGTVDKLSSLKGGLQSLSPSFTTSRAMELASTACGQQKVEAEGDVQSMIRDSTMWSSYVSSEQESKQDFELPNSLQRVEASGNIPSSSNNDLAKTNQSEDKWESSHPILEIVSTSEAGLQCTSRLFSFEDPTTQASDVPCSIGICAGPRRFSFQRLINGDISDLEDDEDDDEDDYDEGVGEEDGKKVFNEDKDGNGQKNQEPEKPEAAEANEEPLQEESEVYSVEWNQSDQPPEHRRDPDVDVSKSESQQSDDMYHGQEGLSSERLCSQTLVSHIHSECSPSEKGYNGDIETDTEVDAGAHSGCHPSTSYRSTSPSRWQQVGRGSSCQGPAADADCKISSNVSTDFDTLPRQLPSSSAIRLKIKMPKEVTLKEVPGTAKTLLASGLLEGCPVRYQDSRGGTMLTGVVQKGGILCNCTDCKGRTIVNVSGFEKHAGSNARHPSDNIFLDNGKSLHDILRIGWDAREGNFEDALRKAINSTEVESEKNSTRSGCSSVVAHSRREHSTNAESLVVGYNHQRRSDTSSLKSSQAPQLSQTRDMNLHKMLFLPGGLADGTEVAYYIKGQHILAGVKKGHGICCSCCNEVVSCSSFEAHAGWGSRRNPYNSIYLPDGRSLHEAALALVAEKQEESLNDSSKDNDDFCTECGDGGNLVLCDGCPGAYHTECVGLLRIPEGDWFCPLCQAKTGHDKRQPDKKITRVSGRVVSVSTKEKLQERCQRVVKASKNAIGGCVLCKNGDFLKSGFGAKTIMLCDQCEREYHVGCMKEKGVADLQELPAGEWFCSVDCERIHNFLEALVLGGPEPVHTSICTTVLEKKQQKSGPGQLKPNDSEFTWQLLHGRRGDPQNGKILSEAATIFTESFDPIVDATSGRDLISLMVYSRSIRDQDFGGMYCAVLKSNETVVSAAIFRVFGRQFAEMPLVATNSSNRGQGYFQMLMCSIERLLGVLQVEHLILPAAEGAEGIWINKFGFSKLQEGQLQQFGSEVQMMIFQGSSMLLKAIPLQRSSRCHLNK